MEKEAFHEFNKLSLEDDGKKKAKEFAFRVVDNEFEPEHNAAIYFFGGYREN